MKKFFASSLTETTLITALVVVTSYFGWQMYTNNSFNVLKWSSINKNGAKNAETTGTIADLIADTTKYAAASPKWKEAYTAALNQIKDLILSEQGTTAEKATKKQIEVASQKAQDCIDSPSTCTSLMVVTAFSASLPEKISGTDSSSIVLTYNYTYVADNGTVKTGTVTKTATVKKEVLSKYNNSTSDYINSLNSLDKTTGSASKVEKVLNADLDSGDNTGSSNDGNLTLTNSSSSKYFNVSDANCKNMASGQRCSEK